MACISTRLITTCLIAGLAAVSTAFGQDSAFTYQGELADGGQPAGGSYDFQFSLWDAVTGGSQVGTTEVLNGVQVNSGLFTVQLDFGADAFDNAARWLEIAVNGTTLDPRQPITRTPYSTQTRGIFVDADYNVGIGTTEPGSMLEVVSIVDAHGIRSTVPWIPVWAHRASTTGTWPAVHGECDSLASGASAVRGIITDASPGSSSAGVRGINNGTGASGIGVYGSQAGSGCGVYGEVAHNGIGVYGHHSSTIGDEPGVRGETNSASSQSCGVYGLATASSGHTDGVRGRSYSTNGTGVSGRAMAATGITCGVFGQSDSTTGIGVSGWAATGSGATYGGRFTAASADGIGVFGWHDSGNGTAPAVMGRTDSDDSYAIAVHGLVNTTAAGGFSTAVRGENLSETQLGIGVWGSQNGSGWGVYGTCPNGIGVYGSGGALAVYSDGNCHVAGTLTKSAGSFKIDHPLDPANMYLHHSFVESPDMMNIYNGNVITDAAGYATIEMPDWFEALNADFRYQLTVIDDSDDFVLAKVTHKMHHNQFTIRTSAPRVEVSWQVTGIRIDPYAMEHRIPVEEYKPAHERGLYEHPELFGQPREMSINHVNGPEAQSRH